MSPIALIVVGFAVAGIGASATIYGGYLAKLGFDRMQGERPTPQAIGGKGGDASVSGHGISIGGPGGNVSRSGVGRGGDGGSATVTGAGFGLAAGGEGGSVDGINIWHPPARSGYEIAMERLGQKPDPSLKQFGRGGMSAGYLARYQAIEQLRQGYFASHSTEPQSVDVNIGAVPLDFINTRLKEMGVPWRARVTSYDQYEFYIPDF